ncbi:hemicentin-1-like [Anguilla rostrata]|uniref:hemicentin-1-like n=1 Tax=Anguilla rostrata TaxID=7938 RepID=UPI0030D19C01
MKDAVCLFLLVSATAVASSAALEISVPPSVTGEEGLPLNIPCNFTPPPRTDGRRLVGTWRKEGLIVVHFSMSQSIPGAGYDGRLGRWRDFASGGCSLVIRAARTEDSGEYTIAVQEDGPEPRRTRTASVAVRVTARPGPVIPGSIQHAWQKPKLSLTPESVWEGEALTLTCAVESHPWGKLSLHKLGEPRPLKEGFAAQLTLTLTLPNVSREDSGEYSCVFQHGKNTGTSTIQVSVMPVVLSAALEISVPSVVTGEEGLPLNIPCNFTPPPRTDGRRLVGTWRKEGLIVVHFSMGQSVPAARYDGRLGRWRDFSSGQCSLVIRAARMEDSGEYTIAVQAARTEESEEYTGAEDGPEPRRTRTASVAVRVTARPGPVIPGSIQHAWQKPKLSLTPESVWEGEALTLTCAVESHPRGKLSLHKLGEPRPLKEGLAAQLTLTLPNVSREDSGEYSCVFQHGKNTGTSTIQVSVMPVVPSAALEISVPSVVTGEEGLPLNIPCNYTHPPRTDGRRLVGTWRKEGLIVVHFSMSQSVPGAGYDGRLGRWRDFASGGCSLVIRVARTEDSGVYTIAVQEDGPEPRRTHTASVAVRVTARPGPVIPGSIQHAWQKPKLSLTPESVREGEALTLTCAVESHARGKLSLHKLGEPRPLKEGFAAQLTLTLPNVSREDSGEYSCVFQHGKNTGTSTIQVSVIQTFNIRNLGIIVGVSLSIAIIFLLCCIYMVHKRLKGKKQKQERELNDPYTTLDHKTMSPDYDIIRRTTANS